MTVTASAWDQVRRRASFACEYCSVTELDTGGLLIIDHHRPQSRDGADDLDNLVYCCFRCNGYKGDYWPTEPSDPALWNPRLEPIEKHLLAGEDGLLLPLTATGSFTLNRLALNRPQLVAHRLLARVLAERLSRSQEFAILFARLQHEYAKLLKDHHTLLEEHQQLLRLFLSTLE